MSPSREARIRRYMAEVGCERADAEEMLQFVVMTDGSSSSREEADSDVAPMELDSGDSDAPTPSPPHSPPRRLVRGRDRPLRSIHPQSTPEPPINRYAGFELGDQMTDGEEDNEGSAAGGAGGGRNRSGSQDASAEQTRGGEGEGEGEGGGSGGKGKGRALAPAKRPASRSPGPPPPKPPPPAQIPHPHATTSSITVEELNAQLAELVIKADSADPVWLQQRAAILARVPARNANKTSGPSYSIVEGGAGLDVHPRSHKAGAYNDGGQGVEHEMRQELDGAMNKQAEEAADGEAMPDVDGLPTVWQTRNPPAVPKPGHIKPKTNQRTLLEAKAALLGSQWASRVPQLPPDLVNLKHADDYSAAFDLEAVSPAEDDWPGAVPAQELGLIECAIQVYFEVGVQMQRTSVATAFHFIVSHTSLFSPNDSRPKKEKERELNLVLSIASTVLAQRFTVWTPRNQPGRGKGANKRWGFNIGWAELADKLFPEWDYELARLEDYFDTCLRRPQINSRFSQHPGGLPPQMAARCVALANPAAAHETAVPVVVDRSYEAMLSHPAYTKLLAQLRSWTEEAVLELARRGLEYRADWWQIKIRYAGDLGMRQMMIQAWGGSAAAVAGRLPMTAGLGLPPVEDMHLFRNCVILRVFAPMWDRFVHEVAERFVPVAREQLGLGATRAISPTKLNPQLYGLLSFKRAVDRSGTGTATSLSDGRHLSAMARLRQSSSQIHSRKAHPTAFNKDGSVLLDSSPVYADGSTREILMNLFQLTKTEVIDNVGVITDSWPSLGKSWLIENVRDPALMERPDEDQYQFSRRLRNMDNYAEDRGATVGGVSICPPAGPAENNEEDVAQHSSWLVSRLGQEPTLLDVAAISTQTPPPEPGNSPRLGPQLQGSLRQSSPWMPEEVLLEQGQYVAETECVRLRREEELSMRLRSELVKASTGLCATKTTFGNYFNHAGAHDCLFLIRVVLSLAYEGGYLTAKTCKAIFTFIINIGTVATLSARPAIYVDLLGPFLRGLNFGVEAELSGMVTRVLTDLQTLFGYFMTSMVQYTDSQSTALAPENYPEEAQHHRLCATLASAALHDFICNTCGRAIFVNAETLPRLHKVGSDTRVLSWTTVGGKRTRDATLWKGIGFPLAGNNARTLSPCFWTFHNPVMSDATRVCTGAFVEVGHYECKVGRRRDNATSVLVDEKVTEQMRKNMEDEGVLDGLV